jgi:hypothetical protein
MQSITVRQSTIALVAILFGVAACSDKGTTSEPPVPSFTGTPLELLGIGSDTTRYTAEVAVRGNVAYTTTWGTRRAVGNRVSVWDVTTTAPVLVDSLIVANATTTGDVAVSDDGSILVVATERTGGAIAIYSLTDPKHPKLLTRYSTANTNPGVHTAEIGRVNGKLYGFLSIDPLGTVPARLVTVDLSDPANPREVFNRLIGNPYVHDTYVRDGILFLGLWNDGVQIWDIGGGGKGGSPESPVVLGTVRTIGGEVHNIWWYHDATGAKKYAFVGQEGPGSIGTSSVGDVHVIDVSDMTQPKEVAFFHVNGAGTHNFSVDEQKGVLYAAYYNGGVQAIDVRGDLGTCTPAQQEVNVPANLTRCNLDLMGRRIATGLTLNRSVYVWGVQYLNGRVYASDMLAGLYVLNAAK